MRAAWEINPAIAVGFVERFKHAAVPREVGALIRSHPRDVLHIPKAIELLVGDTLDARRDLRVGHRTEQYTQANRHDQYLLFWDPVPPVVAVTFFEPRYHSDPMILQYAHRVLAQHPVDVTFFFVPQIVQALRHDELGGSSRVQRAEVIDSHSAYRVCRPLHIRDRQDIPAILSPNYLEYEGQLL